MFHVSFASQVGNHFRFGENVSSHFPVQVLSTEKEEKQAAIQDAATISIRVAHIPFIGL